MVIENADCLIINDFVSERVYVRSAGPYRLATELRKYDYTVQILECFSDLTKYQRIGLFKRIIGKNTKFVGFNSTFLDSFKPYIFYYSNEKINEILSEIKEINPNIKSIVGGYQAMKYRKPFDVVIKGLADNAIVEYMKFLDKKNPFLKYEIHEEKMIINGDDYHKSFLFQESQIIYNKEDNIINGETLPIEVGRGCIFKCKFCSYALNGKKKNDYMKSASVLREEFIKNYYEYGITTYTYSDDTHNDNTEKLKNLANLVQSLPFELNFACFLRLDLFKSHPEQYQLLKDGGLIGCTIGIETLNHQSGKAIGKGLEPKKIIDELYNFKNKLPNVGTFASFIIGLPHESKNSVYEWTTLLADKDFPVDTININPLFMQQNTEKFYKSEFEIDSSKYYTWVDGINLKSNFNWHNGHFDREWAKSFCEDFYKKIDFKQRLGGFDSAILRKYNKVLLNEIPVKELRSEYIKKYFDKIFNNL
jgi:radical SAM superfamily enzyme YgiQ (UPF0313 family)